MHHYAARMLCIDQTLGQAAAAFGFLYVQLQLPGVMCSGGRGAGAVKSRDKTECMHVCVCVCIFILLINFLIYFDIFLLDT